MKMLYVSQRKFLLVDVEPKLQEYYEVLGCDLVEFVKRNIGGRNFYLICDEEGRFKQFNAVTAFNKGFEPDIVGAMLVCGIDERCNERDLTDEELTILVRNSLQIEVELGGKNYTRYALRNVEYPH